jgi:hypothetical protein
MWKYMRVFGAMTPAAVLLLLIFGNFSSTRAQADSIYRLPAGTRLTVKLDAELSSAVSSVNDTFLAVVTKPVIVRDTVVLTRGTLLEGRVERVEPAGYGGKAGRLDVRFEWLRLPRDQSRKIEAERVNVAAIKSSRRFMTLTAIGGAIIGTAAGAATKAPINAVIGAGVGGGAGAVIGLAKRGREAKIAKDEEFEIELRAEVTLPVLDY